jgi:uridine kinase
MEVGGNWDWERIREQVLTPLSNNMAGKYQEYDWRVDQMTNWHNVPTGGFVIIEGCYSIRKELADFYDLRLWVESPKSLRLDRGIERDGEATRHLWEELWMPGEEHYMKIQEPTNWADLIIDGTGEHGNITNNEINIISSPIGWFK